MAKNTGRGSSAAVKADARIFGVWREGPWMAVRTSTNDGNGRKRLRPVYVIELKMPHQRYETYQFGSRVYRDLWAWYLRQTPMWRRGERYRLLLEANRRAYR